MFFSFLVIMSISLNKFRKFVEIFRDSKDIWKQFFYVYSKVGGIMNLRHKECIGQSDVISYTERTSRILNNLFKNSETLYNRILSPF